MPTVEQALDAKTELGADLAAGVNTLSLNQTVRFTKYVRLVLPLDGFVFWVKADLLSASALYNASQFNVVKFNQPQLVTTTAATIEVQGSLHYATDTRQEDTETYAVNQVVFTSLQEVTDLSEVGPTILYIGEFDGIKFAFSSRKPFYRQAGLWHYVGNAVYSDMETQLIDSVDGFDPSQVVSNSLPFWLALNGYTPPPGSLRCPTVLYPSYLLPNNLPPPYGAVQIDSTSAIAGAPTLSNNLSHDQLARERVLVTTYGLRNNLAQDLLDCVLQYSLDQGNIGIMNQPIVRDEKRVQSELGTIAQKKTIEFEVNYLQSRARDIARQLILSAVPSFHIAS